MKLLFVTAFPPNRKTAGQNYSRELLNSLTADLEIDLISFSYPTHEIELDNKIKVLKTYNTSLLSKVLGWFQIPFIHPFFSSRFRIDLLFFLIKNVKKYDFIYFDFSQVFVYSLFLKNKYKIMMSHDVIYQKMNRNRFFKLNPINLLLFKSERRILQTANLVLTFSNKDITLLKDLYNIDAKVVSFFIDEKIKKIDFKEITITRKFCFFGAWNRPENLEGLVWFMENVFEFIDENVSFEVIGPGLKTDFFDKYSINNRIKYVGFLDNPYKNIAESLALIAPIFHGAGVKVKVIESLGTGTSIIGTDIAFEGIDNLGDGSMILCKTNEEYIKAINTFPLDILTNKIKTKLLFDKTYNSKLFKDFLKN